MTRAIFAVFLILFSISNYAQSDQSINARWSKSIAPSKNSKGRYLIGIDEDRAYIIEFIRKKYFFEAYSLETFSLIQSFELKPELNGEKLKLADYKMINNTPIIFSSYFKKKENKTSYYAQAVNTSTFQLGNPVKTSEVTIAKGGGLVGLINRQLLISLGSTMYTSEEGSKALFLTSKNELKAYQPLKEEKLDPNNRYSGILFDDKLNELNQFDIKLPYEYFFSSQLLLGEDGILYLFGDEAEYISDGEQMVLNLTKKHIVMVDCESGSYIIKDIDLKDGEIAAAKMELLNDGGFQIVGLTTYEDVGVTGAFSLNFDNEYELTTEKQNTFESNYFSIPDLKGKVTSPFAGVFKSYKIDNVIEKDNGTTTMLVEKYEWSMTHTSYIDASGKSQTMFSYSFKYGDVLVVDFNKTGEINWHTIVKKEQISDNDQGYYSSFFVTPLEDDGLAVMYNVLYDPSIPRNQKQLQVAKENVSGKYVIINKKGEQTVGELYFYNDLEARLVATKCKSIDKSKAFLYANGSQGAKIGILSLK
jgi:hypothetical protein